jgi:hypothetical protein
MEAAAPGRAASGHEPHSGRRQLSLLQPRSGDISLATSVSWLGFGSSECKVA